MPIGEYGGNVTFRTAQIAVGTSPTLIKPANANDRVQRLFNNDTQTIWIGDSSVTPTTGLPIVVGAFVTLGVRAAIYGCIAASSSSSSSASSTSSGSSGSPVPSTATISGLFEVNAL